MELQYTSLAAALAAQHSGDNFTFMRGSLARTARHDPAFPDINLSASTISLSDPALPIQAPHSGNTDSRISRVQLWFLFGSRTEASAVCDSALPGPGTGPRRQSPAPWPKFGQARPHAITLRVTAGVGPVGDPKRPGGLQKRLRLAAGAAGRRKDSEACPRTERRKAVPRTERAGRQARGRRPEPMTRPAATGLTDDVTGGHSVQRAACTDEPRAGGRSGPRNRSVAAARAGARRRGSSFRGPPNSQDTAGAPRTSE